MPLESGGGCNLPFASGVDGTPAGLAAWVADHPGLIAGEPQDVTIGGVPGRMVDAAAEPAWPGLCPGGGRPVVVLFGEADVANGRQWGTTVGERSRFVFLDLGEAQPVLAEITAREDLFDALLPEAMEIIESFRFE